MRNNETLIMFPDPAPQRPSDADILGDWAEWAFHDRRFELGYALAKIAVQAHRQDLANRPRPLRESLADLADQVPANVIHDSVFGRSAGGPGPQDLAEADADRIAQEAQARAGTLLSMTRPPEPAPGLVTPSTRCRYEVSPGSECHGVLFWSDGNDVTTAGWHHLDGGDDHLPRP